MLKNIVRHERKKCVEFTLVFALDEYGNGFAFPCDGWSGKLLPGLAEEAIANYEMCMAHPEKFVRFAEVEKNVWTYEEPGHGNCSCGEGVELWDQYMGACECPKCGKWYNLFGQELIHPKYWEEDA